MIGRSRKYGLTGHSSGFNVKSVFTGNSLIFLFYAGFIVIGQRKRSPDMLLIGVGGWIILGVAVVIMAVFIGSKIKDKYY